MGSRWFVLVALVAVAGCTAADDGWRCDRSHRNMVWMPGHESCFMSGKTEECSWYPGYTYFVTVCDHSYRINTTTGNRTGEERDF